MHNNIVFTPPAVRGFEGPLLGLVAMQIAPQRVLVRPGGPVVGESDLGQGFSTTTVNGLSLSPVI